MMIVVMRQEDNGITIMVVECCTAVSLFTCTPMDWTRYENRSSLDSEMTSGKSFQQSGSTKVSPVAGSAYSCNVVADAQGCYRMHHCFDDDVVALSNNAVVNPYLGLTTNPLQDVDVFLLAESIGQSASIRQHKLFTGLLCGSQFLLRLHTRPITI